MMFAKVNLTLALLPATALASAPADHKRLDQTSSKACLQAAGLKDGQVGAVTRFNDQSGVDARVVTGKWPQPHMKNARTSMLCLFDRRTGRAEVQEFAR